MRGTFNSTIRAQVAGQSNAPLVGQTMLNTAPTSQASATAPRSFSTIASHSTSSSVAASSTSGAASTPSNSAALSSKASWMAIIFGALTGVTTF